MHLNPLHGSFCGQCCCRLLAGVGLLLRSRLLVAVAARVRSGGPRRGGVAQDRLAHKPRVHVQGRLRRHPADALDAALQLLQPRQVALLQRRHHHHHRRLWRPRKQLLHKRLREGHKVLRVQELQDVELIHRLWLHTKAGDLEVSLGAGLDEVGIPGGAPPPRHAAFYPPGVLKVYEGHEVYIIAPAPKHDRVAGDVHNLTETFAEAARHGPNQATLHLRQQIRVKQAHKWFIVARARVVC
ncbi:uncharacterized protein Tco025E_00082 [Trypanosoma conorhini]|uniref:Uncharacterized protein n=1 Tax=Trypanosoma conorhini TaxID=83891 RepID=A0A3R7P251_9TRYP|nr:uncharacterized protein Tco025E_00082 [Trypanosoma conorhini]RNF27698.1 hypothetical protein Tco025E_00082 [Trypanosoma conorhini]